VKVKNKIKIEFMLPLIIIKFNMNIIMKEIMIEKNVSVRISIRILHCTFLQLCVKIDYNFTN
jgi:hypothetical protein